MHDALLAHGDHYMHLADLKSYLEADQRLVDLYADPDASARKAILNVAGSGKFSSDRTIAEYAAIIWNAEPCPVSDEDLRSNALERPQCPDIVAGVTSAALGVQPWPNEPKS